MVVRVSAILSSLLLAAVAVPVLWWGSSSSSSCVFVQAAFSSSQFVQLPKVHDSHLSVNNELTLRRRPFANNFNNDKNGFERRRGGSQPTSTRTRTRMAMADISSISPFLITGGEVLLPQQQQLLPDGDVIATGLGYLLGAGSLGLYTPIAIRVIRQKSANGLVADTWWLKLASYTCSDIYFWRNHLPISTYIETLIITIEAAIILGLVSYYQNNNVQDGEEQEQDDDDCEEDDKSPGGGDGSTMKNFLGRMALYTTITGWGITLAPASVVALGQGLGSSILNTGALIPQFALNARTKSSGDYSPVTAGIAATGCAIRIFTIVQLADSDPILLATFGLALVLNMSLFSQILWYGVTAEGKSISSLLLSDFMDSSDKDDDDDDDMTMMVKMDMKNKQLVNDKPSKEEEGTVLQEQQQQEEQSQTRV